MNGRALALGATTALAVGGLVASRLTGARNTDARHATQTDTPAFRAWFKDSHVVDPDTGRPRVVYHGTTHDFDAFNLKNTNVENHHGRGFYFTTAREDVVSNYARVGPDLVNRIESRMDELSEMDDQDTLVDTWAKAHPGRKKDAATLRRSMTNGTVSTYQSVGYTLMREVRRWHAEQRLVGSHGGAVLPVYLSIQNPVDLRTSLGRTTGETYFGIQTRWIREGRDDEEVRQTGLGVKAQDVIRAIAATYWDPNLAQAILEQLDTYEGFSARELEAAVRSLEVDWMSEHADPGSPGEFLRQVYEKLGFDGIVEDAYAAFGSTRRHGMPMVGVSPGTEHWVAFKPSQIKSAIGNRGTFSARSPRISANRGSAATRAVYTPRERERAAHWTAKNHQDHAKSHRRRAEQADEGGAEQRLHRTAARAHQIAARKPSLEASMDALRATSVVEQEEGRGSAARRVTTVQSWPPPMPKTHAAIYASIYRWTSGGCLDFAQALHEHHGYPLVVITPAFNLEYAIHVACVVPGGYVDALGFRTEAELREAYARVLAWEIRNDRKEGYDIPPGKEILLFRQLPLVEIENIMDTEVRPDPRYLEPGTTLPVDEASAIIAANPERYGRPEWAPAGEGSAARRAPARTVESEPRYTVIHGGGNGPGITRFLPDEHTLDKRVEWVNPENLEVDPLDAERNPERLRSVMRALRDGTPLPALIVYEGDGIIWDGHHRHQAALKLKIPLVPVQWLRYR